MSIFQPTNQGAISTFKACYAQRVMHQLLTEMDGVDKLQFESFGEARALKQALKVTTYLDESLTVTAMTLRDSRMSVKMLSPPYGWL